MNDLTKEMVDLIQRNRISTVETADAMDKLGVIDGLHALNDLHFAVGKVHYVFTFGESNWPLHEQIGNIPEDCILFVDAFDCSNRAIFGDIVSKYLMLYKKVKAIVINGYLRDAHRLKKENYPFWLKGVTPKGCFNKRVEMSSDLENEIEKRQNKFQDTIMVCDDSGVTHISQEYISEDMMNRLDFIELQEDIWYYCIDTLKWNTFDTICLKKYLNKPNELPSAMNKKLKKYLEK